MYLVSILILLISTQQPDINIILEQLGYTTPPYEIQLTWQENTKKGLCTGILIINTNTNEFAEIYLNPYGKLISEEELKHMGITPKKWGPKVIEIPASINRITSKTGKQNFLSSQPTYYEIEQLRKKSFYPRNALTLPPPNNLYEESDADISKGGVVIGNIVGLDENIEIFSKSSKIATDVQNIDVMEVKSLGFISNSAKGLRLKLKCEENLPPQHKVFIRGENDDEIKLVSFYGKEVWTPFTMGPVAYLYYCKPLTSSKDFQPIIVSDYAFIFKDPVEELTKVASCYEDVMCYSPWDSMSLGVVGLESINSKYLIFCTGSVLSDNNPMTVSNLILTANHCVSTQEEADSLEFFWFYQSSVCNGDVPYLYTVPITSGGATLLATSNLSTGTDVTLLQMKNQPPDNIYEFGYANYAVNINTEVVVIHHPGGSYKRISFGKTTNSGSPYYDNMNLQPLTRFYEVKYYLSSTEAGSSGSPLISVDTGLILGQLWGGTASCSYMDEPDYFGRFDVSFQFLQPFLPIGEINYDIDGSGKIDEKDLTLVVDASLGINQNSSADLNKDGKFNASDIQLMWNKLVGEE